jgi:hypothetical protein
MATRKAAAPEIVDSPRAFQCQLKRKNETP